jgi:transposase
MRSKVVRDVAVYGLREAARRHSLPHNTILHWKKTAARQGPVHMGGRPKKVSRAEEAALVEHAAHASHTNFASAKGVQECLVCALGLLRHDDLE